MKKTILLLLTILLLGSGCSKESTETSIKAEDIKGYWLQTERDWSGEVTDLSDNQYAYFEVTDDTISFYSISFNEDEGYSVANKYYKLEDNKLYYDYYELKGDDWKQDISGDYGGIYYVSFVDNNLVLTEYSNDVDKTDGYEKDTYVKLDQSGWPIGE